jgi:hypothetical protein
VLTKPSVTQLKDLAGTNAIGKFCEKFKVTYELIDPDKYDLYYKYLPVHLTGEARANLLVKQDADDWDI